MACASTPSPQPWCPPNPPHSHPHPTPLLIKAVLKPRIGPFWSSRIYTGILDILCTGPLGLSMVLTRRHWPSSKNWSSKSFESDPDTSLIAMALIPVLAAAACLTTSLKYAVPHYWSLPVCPSHPAHSCWFTGNSEVLCGRSPPKTKLSVFLFQEVLPTFHISS